DRRKLAAVAHHHRADFVLVYLDTPLEVIGQRQAENARTRTRHSVPEADMRLDASLLEPPDPAEQAIYVSPADDLTDVLTRITARLGRGGQASLLPPSETSIPHPDTPRSVALLSAGAAVLRSDPHRQPHPDGRGPVRRAGHRGRDHRRRHCPGRRGARPVGGPGGEGRLRGRDL